MHLINRNFSFAKKSFKLAFRKKPKLDHDDAAAAGHDGDSTKSLDQTKSVEQGTTDDGQGEREQLKESSVVDRRSQDEEDDETRKKHEALKETKERLLMAIHFACMKLGDEVLSEVNEDRAEMSRDTKGLQFDGCVLAQLACLVLDTLCDTWPEELLRFAKHGKRSIVNVSDLLMLVRRNDDLVKFVNDASKTLKSTSVRRQKSSTKSSRSDFQDSEDSTSAVIRRTKSNVTANRKHSRAASKTTKQTSITDMNTIKITNFFDDDFESTKQHPSTSNTQDAVKSVHGDGNGDTHEVFLMNDAAASAIASEQNAGAEGTPLPCQNNFIIGSKKQSETKKDWELKESECKNKVTSGGKFGKCDTEICDRILEMEYDRTVMLPSTSKGATGEIVDNMKEKYRTDDQVPKLPQGQQQERGEQQSQGIEVIFERNRIEEIPLEANITTNNLNPFVAKPKLKTTSEGSKTPEDVSKGALNHECSEDILHWGGGSSNSRDMFNTPHSPLILCPPSESVEKLCATRNTHVTNATTGNSSTLNQPGPCRNLSQSFGERQNDYLKLQSKQKSNLSEDSTDSLFWDAVCVDGSASTQKAFSAKVEQKTNQKDIAESETNNLDDFFECDMDFEFDDVVNEKVSTQNELNQHPNRTYPNSLNSETAKFVQTTDTAANIDTVIVKSVRNIPPMEKPATSHFSDFNFESDDDDIFLESVAKEQAPTTKIDDSIKKGNQAVSDGSVVLTVSHTNKIDDAANESVTRQRKDSFDDDEFDLDATIFD